MSTEHLLKRRFRLHYKVCSLVSYFDILVTSFCYVMSVTLNKIFCSIVTQIIKYLFIYF